MSQTQVTGDSLRNPHPTMPASVLAEIAEPILTETEEVEMLRGENAALRAKADELEQLVALSAQEAEERWAERQREYESLVEEKSDVIRGLHQKIAELRERAASSSSHTSTAAAAAAAVVDDSGEATPDRQELLRLKRELEEARDQMLSDEESMMAQMRQMEMALARDRAELARQRSELQRLHGDLKHDMESAARAPGLRERLTALQRPTTKPPVRSSASQDTPPPVQAPATKSGLFRRIFGAGQ
jgi:DNA repair exonuclease SbcCD ATPase subunit